MKNKLTILLLALLAPLLLSGCQLARADGAADTGQSDRLIGVAVTTEHLNLFDFERYMRDHSSQLIWGGEISTEDTQGYEGRIYATLKSELTTHDETGEDALDWEYTFENLNAMTLFCAHTTSPDGRNSFWGMTSSGEISDAQLAMDEGITVEGTLYTRPKHSSTFYINPVYQSADGQVYLTAGQGFSASGVSDEGSVYTQTLKQTETVTENGETTEHTDTVTLHIAVKYPTVRLRVIHMDAQNMPQAQEEYAADRLPAQISVETDTAYLIVEQTVNTLQGEQVRRSLLGREEGTITAYRAQSDGICVAVHVSVVWKY